MKYSTKYSDAIHILAYIEMLKEPIYPVIELLKVSRPIQPMSAESWVICEQLAWLRANGEKLNLNY